MSDATKAKVVTLICERSAELKGQLTDQGGLKDLPGVTVVKFPCSGMIQPLMIEAALKAGMDGVIVCGCQIGDCYYREGNRMIRDRLLGERPPGLKKTVDRRRVVGLWLSRLQTQRLLSEAKEFVAVIKQLGPSAAPAADGKPQTANEGTPGADKAKAEGKPKSEGKKSTGGSGPPGQKATDSNKPKS